MVTIKAAKEKIRNLVLDLRRIGYNPSKAVLFGSVAKQTSREDSDIDVAIWDKKFTGSKALDYESIVKVLHLYPRVELHTYNSRESIRSNPFIREILETGIEINISEGSRSTISKRANRHKIS